MATMAAFPANRSPPARINLQPYGALETRLLLSGVNHGVTEFGPETVT